MVAYLQRTDPALLRQSAPRDLGDATTTAPAGKRSWQPLAIGLVILALLSPLGLLASGTAWGEWGADEVGAEQIGFHLRSLNETDRTALAGELSRLGGTTADPEAARELRAAGELLGSDDQAGATEPLDTQIETLRAADRTQYPQIAALAATVREPTGLTQWSSFWTAPIPDYAPGFLRSTVAGYIISAIVGIAVVVGLAALIGRLLVRRRPLTGSES